MRNHLIRSVIACLIGCATLAAALPETPKYKLVLQTPPATSVDSVAVSPDGSLVATAGGEEGVQLYNARTGALVRTIGEVGDKRVAFLPRHGVKHELPPHAIPYRANVWAMKELGVRRIIGPNASGALKAELRLGEFVVCDQFVDRTSGRPDTFYDGGSEGPATHVSAADPFPYNQG